MRLMQRFFSVLLALAIFPVLVKPISAQHGTKIPFEFFKGDRIAIVGNTLADRMQHLGHGFEASLQLAHPGYGLTVRNLGFSGDELGLRLRSADFGSPDQWLAKVKASVVIAMFGYNESFAGREGLAGFEKELAEYVDHLLSAKFDGNQSPRVILCSPTAFEAGPKREGVKAMNERLGEYTEAMRKIAALKKVAFVDLFGPTMEAYEASRLRRGLQVPYTINGVHLSEVGYEFISTVLAKSLFGGKKIDEQFFKSTYAAVLDKDWHWFQRYRVTDGYSIFGGRADLKFVGGQTNREVMARELEVLEVMVANRDKVIHATAQGQSAKADDSNTPAFIPVQTNKPGPLDGGKHLFLSGKNLSRK